MKRWEVTVDERGKDGNVQSYHYVGLHYIVTDDFATAETVEGRFKLRSWPNERIESVREVPLHTIKT
jgi:hypothetical protein